MPGITLLLQYFYRHARYCITVTILLQACPVSHYSNHTFTGMLYYITLTILLQACLILHYSYHTLTGGLDITLLLWFFYRRAQYNITVTILLHVCPVLHYCYNTFTGVSGITLILGYFYRLAWYYITLTILLQACPVGPEANILEPSEEQCQRLWLQQPILSLTDLQVLKVVHHRGWRVSQQVTGQRSHPLPHRSVTWDGL